MKLTEIEKLVVKMSGLLISAQHRISSLETACAFLWSEKEGRKAEDLMEFFRTESADSDEKSLLEIGDADPELAKLADVLKRLNKWKSG